MTALPLAVTMGDPNGIGPEIVARALLARTPGAAPAVVVGCPQVMRRALRQCGLAAVVATLDRLSDHVACPPGVLAVWAPPGLPAGLAERPQGCVDAQAGAAAAAAIEAGARAVMAGQAAALVTAPIHKEALAAAGLPWPGHTEMLQALAGGAPVRMMLANPELRVVLVTIHVALREALDLVTAERVLATLRIAHAAAAHWGQPAPRIGVAGLNPHAGEGGLFGREEIEVIAPAIAAACAEGIDARGPFAPDTVFMRARNAAGHPGEFDLVVAMTHDHGLIPVKYLGVDHGVNVTLGLPFVRTSPDHGTAFDIAGRGIADPSSLRAALAWAEAAAGSAVSGASTAPPAPA